MAANQTKICNRALHFIGIGEEIASIDERSPEAEACKMFYDDSLEELLREFAWPFAKRRVALATVNDVDTDGETLLKYSDEFFYGYRYPADCIYALRIVSGSVPDSNDSLIRYQVESDSSGRIIASNTGPDATLEYIARITDTTLFPVDFAMALSFRIASYIAPRLSEDPKKAADVAMRGYQASLTKARSVSAMEECAGKPPESSFRRAR